MNEIVSKLQEFRDMYNRPLVEGHRFTKPISIRYDLRGRVAGQARHIIKTDEFVIRINMECFANYREDYMDNTLPHELAHLIVMDRWPTASPHGERWASVMYHLGVSPTRCHDYVVTPARIVSKYPYTCLCQIHSVAKRTHNRMQQGHYRTCNRCHARLILMDEVSDE